MSSCLAQSSIPHLANVEVYPLVVHPSPPLVKLAVLPGGPILQVIGTRPLDDLWHAMPRIPRLFRHVNGISRAQPQQQVLLLALLLNFLLVVGRHHEQAIAAETQTDEALVRLLADVAVHHHGVLWRVKVKNRRLRLRRGEEVVQELRNVMRKLGRRLGGIHAVRPVVLSAKSDPVKALLEDLLDG